MANEGDFNLQALLATPLLEPIPDLPTRAILAQPPFEAVPGLINARWLPPPIRPKYLFRSGAVNHLTTEGKQTLVDLGIKSMFDLRSMKERSVEPDPEIDGIECKWEPSTFDNDTTAGAQSQQQDPNNFSFVKMYLDMFESHKAALKSVLLHIRDHPERPLLFHCTAGKDRTGILAALLLTLAGADSAVVDHDYALTRIGTEPAREMLTQKLFQGKPIDLEDPLLRAYAQMPMDAMSQTLSALSQAYESGVKGYVLSELLLSEEDLAKIHKNLTVQP